MSFLNIVHQSSFRITIIIILDYKNTYTYYIIDRLFKSGTFSWTTNAQHFIIIIIIIYPLREAKSKFNFIRIHNSSVTRNQISRHSRRLCSPLQVDTLSLIA